MKRLLCIVLFLFISFTAFFIISSPILADNLPSGIKPQQGIASGRVQNAVSSGDHFGATTVKITFWNVGELGGSNYGKASVTTMNSDLIDNIRVQETTIQGSFSGGPDGVITLEGSKAKLRLIKGANVEITYNGKTTLIPLENPEIFSTYDWGEITSVKSPVSPYDEKSTFANPWDETFPPDTNFDENEAVVSKIYGDVEVSDPKFQKNFIQQGVTGFKMLLNDMIFGRVRKAHFEGDRIVEESDFDPSSKWFDPFKGMPLSEGDKMKTGDGRAVLEFKDGTKFILRENSQITFNKNGIYLDNGKYYFMFRKLGKKIYIYSKTAKSTITGTKFEVTVNSDGTLLKVYEGSVVTGSLASKQISKVNAGEEITATDKGLDKAKALSGEKDVDMNALELEIVNKDYNDTKKLGMYIFIFIIIVSILVLVLSIGLILRRKRLKK